MVRYQERRLLNGQLHKAVSRGYFTCAGYHRLASKTLGCAAELVGVPAVGLR